MWTAFVHFLITESNGSLTILIDSSLFDMDPKKDGRGVKGPAIDDEEELKRLGKQTLELLEGPGGEEVVQEFLRERSYILHCVGFANKSDTW